MKHNFLDWLGCGTGVVLTAVQTNEIFQTISLILTCIATLLTIAYNIYRWYKKATEDKKITPEEIKEGIDILNQGAKDIEDLKNKNKEK